MQSLTIRFAPGGGPLYRQLYAALRAEIAAQRLSAGEKLPGKRRLAADLGVSVNTVDAAYGMLAAEGYVEAHARSGFVVCRLDSLPAPAAPVPAPAEAPPAPFLYDCATASIDTTLFPYKTWRRIQQDVLARAPEFLNHGHRQGDEELREAVATHLREYRAVRCGAHQVVIGAGIEYLLGMLARLLCRETFAVEDPGYARTARILHNNGVRAAFIPVDRRGMDTAALAASGARVAYVTPSHQFPTGVTMPVQRRYELLRWAEDGRFLIEDDYDSEFRFDTRPLPSLQGMDGAGRVIYIGTFSKSVAPAIRIAYMVLPETLLGRWRDEFGFYSCTVSRFEQQTLARFLQGGHFARHLGRLRVAYRRRRDALAAALRAQLPGVRLDGLHTGLHLLATVPCGLSPAQMERAAADNGVRCNALADYYAAGAPENAPPAMVLGYAGLPEAAIPGAAAALRRAWLDD